MSPLHLICGFILYKYSWIISIFRRHDKKQITPSQSQSHSPLPAVKEYKGTSSRQVQLWIVFFTTLHFFFHYIWSLDSYYISWIISIFRRHDKKWTTPSQSWSCSHSPAVKESKGTSLRQVQLQIVFHSAKFFSITLDVWIHIIWVELFPSSGGIIRNEQPLPRAGPVLIYQQSRNPRVQVRGKYSCESFFIMLHFVAITFELCIHIKWAYFVLQKKGNKPCSMLGAISYHS